MISRIIDFPLTQMIIGMALIVGAMVLGAQIVQAINPPRDSAQDSFCALLVAAFVILVYKAYRRWIERSQVDEFALKGASQELGLGLFIGFAVFSAAVVIVMLIGDMKIEGVRGWGQFWAMLSMAIISGTFEEALFRGVI